MDQIEVHESNESVKLTFLHYADCDIGANCANVLPYRAFQDQTVYQHDVLAVNGSV